jgi:hypothetical protein
MKQEGKFILLTREEFKEWLNKQNIKRIITKIQQHHTYAPSYKSFKNNHFELVKNMENYHIKVGKMSEIAQNITIFPDGLIMICRTFDKDPAGIYGANANAICIENVGNFDIGGDVMTEEHRKSIIFVNVCLSIKFKLVINTDTIIYHSWFKLKSGGYKSCCGTNWFGGNTKESAIKNFYPLIENEVNKLMNPVKQETKQGKILVSLNIRQSNSTTSTIVGKLNINDMVTILEEQSGWFRISNGWIFGNSGKYVEIVEKPKEETKIETPVKSEVQYPTLQKGSTGVFVLELQKKLQSLGYILIADGIFSSGTFTVVKNFQTDNGLVADGVFGAKSWNALKIAKPKNVNIEIPKESVTEKKYKYYKESLTHVVEIDPMELRISVEDVAANKFKANNYVTSGFITWEAMYDKNGKKLNTVRGVPLGILVSEGRVLSNRQPHRVSAGTLIIYKNGKVECKPILDIVKETNINDVWFAVSGCSILPQIRMKEEGFKVYDNYFGLGYRDFSDIGRTTLRPVIGFNPTKNKIVIAVRPDSDIARGQLTLKSMGCSIGLTLDAGGSTVLKVDGKILVNSTRQLYSVISW